MVTKPHPSDHVFLGFMPEWNRNSDILADWLNASIGTESHNRVVKLIEEIRQVATGMDKALVQGSLEVSRRPKGVKEAMEDLERRHIAINEGLARYSFAPAITRVQMSRSWLLSAYSAPAEGQFDFERRVHKTGKTGGKTFEQKLEHRVNEGDAALHVLILATAGELDRIRQCENCFKWFNAERSNQKFCLESLCRQKKYSASPQFKVYRKLYMRKRRAKEKAAEKPTKGTSVRKRR